MFPKHRRHAPGSHCAAWTRRHRSSPPSITRVSTDSSTSSWISCEPNVPAPAADPDASRFRADRTARRSADAAARCRDGRPARRRRRGRQRRCRCCRRPGPVPATRDRQRTHGCRHGADDGNRLPAAPSLHGTWCQIGRLTTTDPLPHSPVESLVDIPVRPPPAPRSCHERLPTTPVPSNPLRRDRCRVRARRICCEHNYCGITLLS